MITREEFELRKRQWAEMNRWEREQPRPEYTPDEAMAIIDALWHWIPASSREVDRDPERLGIQRMNDLLRALRTR